MFNHSNMEFNSSDIITVSTFLGYVKIKCTQSTTVDEITQFAVQKVSLKSSPAMFGLEICENSLERKDRHFLCPKLTWSKIAGLANNHTILLSIRYFPTQYEDAVRKDRLALYYLNDQINHFYKSIWDNNKDFQKCFEIGCLEIKIYLDCEITETSLDKFEQSHELSFCFPSFVLLHQKEKYLRRAILSYASTIQYFSKEDCILERLNRLLILIQFDSDEYSGFLGAGLGIPVRLLLGPRSQIRVKIGNTTEVRLLTYFVSIDKVIFSEVAPRSGVNGSGGGGGGSNCGKRWYQVKLILVNDPDADQPIIFTFDSKLTADTVVHTIEGYCHLGDGIVFEEAAKDADTPVTGARSPNRSLLTCGCPFLTQQPCSGSQSGQKSTCIESVLVRSNITLERVLGEGQFGDVYKGVYVPPQEIGANSTTQTLPVAVKACKIGLSSDEKQKCLEEAKLHGKLAHPHIVRLYGVCKDEPVWLVLEFAGEGELRHYLLERQNRIPVSTLVTYCHQLSSALAYLEALKIIHRDVAARNVLVATENCVKLADFGMARELDELDFYVAEQGRKVPIKWMAPESLQSRIFSSASDIWMFGVCMWEVLSFGLKPFSSITNAEAVIVVGRGERLVRPAACTSSLYHVMLECWMENPLLRPTFNSLQPKLREILAEVKRNSGAETRSLSSTRRESENGQQQDVRGSPNKTFIQRTELPIDGKNKFLSDIHGSQNDRLETRNDILRVVFDVIEAILIITRSSDLPSPPDLLLSVKNVGKLIRIMFQVIQKTVESLDNVDDIDTAERRLNDSFQYLIEDMQKLRIFFFKDTIRDELYRRFLGQAFVVASDTRAVYQAVQRCQQTQQQLQA